MLSKAIKHPLVVTNEQLAEIIFAVDKAVTIHLDGVIYQKRIFATCVDLFQFLCDNDYVEGTVIFEEDLSFGFVFKPEQGTWISISNAWILL